MAKQASLAAQSGQVAELQLPAIFQAAPEQLESRFLAPYVVFAHHNRADEWKRILSTNPGAEEGFPFLLEKAGVTSLAPVAKLGLITCKQYWCLTNAAGEVQKTAFKEMPKPYKEHIETVVLVYLPDRVIPANMQFRSVKCPAGKALSDALVAATGPDWASLSPQHKETLICTQPFMRFFGEVTVGPQRVSKESGLPYLPAQAKIVPTSVSEWRQLKELCDSPGAQKAMQDAADRFEFRMKEVVAKAT